jgi:hypothetical protein
MEPEESNGIDKEEAEEHYEFGPSTKDWNSSKKYELAYKLCDALHEPLLTLVHREGEEHERQKTTTGKRKWNFPLEYGIEHIYPKVEVDDSFVRIKNVMSIGDEDRRELKEIIEKVYKDVMP